MFVLAIPFAVLNPGSWSSYVTSNPSNCFGYVSIPNPSWNGLVSNGSARGEYNQTVTSPSSFVSPLKSNCVGYRSQKFDIPTARPPSVAVPTYAVPSARPPPVTFTHAHSSFVRFLTVKPSLDNWDRVYASHVGTKPNALCISAPVLNFTHSSALRVTGFPSV